MCSTYHILKDNELILKLAEKWCVETNTFVFPWGEATISLEDMMVLGGYSVLGDSVLSPLGRNGGKHLIAIENRLIKAHGVISQNTRQYASHYRRMDHFMGTGHFLEHEAFIVLWLSRFVFPANYNNNISKIVFPIAIKLSRGISVALAPAVLSSIYRHLRILKQTVFGNNNNTHNLEYAATQYKESREQLLIITAPVQLVKLWAWERFVTLRKEPNPINVVGEPRIARWHKLSKWKVEDVGEVIDAAGDGIFQWRPYSTKLVNWDLKFRKFYKDSPGYILVDDHDMMMDAEVESMVRCLRVSELVGLDCIEQYLPHRVALQFGYDQDLPGYVSRSNETSEIAWRYYNRPVTDVVLHTPGRLFEGDVTTRYLEWWHELKSQNGTNTTVALLSLAEKIGDKKDNLEVAKETLAVDDVHDDLTHAEFKNLKRVPRSLGTSVIQNHGSLPTAKRMLLSANATEVSKSGLESVGSDTEGKLEGAINGGSEIEAIEKMNVGNKETIIGKHEDCVANGMDNTASASEFREMKEEIKVLLRPDKLRNRMMILEHRIRKLEKIIADSKADKIVQRSQNQWR